MEGGLTPKNKKAFYIAPFIVVSLCLHLMFMVGAPIWDWEFFKAQEDTIIEIDQALLEEYARQERMQIVESESAKNRDIPENAKYLSKNNQRVEKETRASKVDYFKSGANKAGKRLSLKNLAPFKVMTRPLSLGDYSLQKRARARQEMSERGGVEAASNDYLKDMTKGKRTLLNTKEFIYYGYYHRIRQRLERAWNTELRAVLISYIRSGRKLSTDRNYVTRLVVVLDRHGRIKKVQILEDSGATELDDAAVDAFNRAGPFPNPPRGLIEKDGLIKIRWDFILQS